MNILEYIYIYTHQKPIGWFSRTDRSHTGTTIKEKRKDRSHGPAKKETETRSFLSAHNVPIRAQATPDKPDNQDTDRPQTDPNRIPDGPRIPAGKPRLARLDLVGYRPSLLFVPVQTSNSIFTASPPLPLLLSPCSSPASWEEKETATTRHLLSLSPYCTRAKRQLAASSLPGTVLDRQQDRLYYSQDSTTPRTPVHSPHI